MRNFKFALSISTLSLLVGSLISIVAGQGRTANFTTDPSFYAEKWTDLPTARGMMIDSAGDVLVVSRSLQEVFAIFDNADGLPEVIQITNSTGLGLNHALTYSEGWLYVSSKSAVYRWPYTPGQRRMVTTPAETVINNIPGTEVDPRFISRPIRFDPRMNFYVGVGAGTNNPPELDSNRTRIRRFRLIGAEFPIDYETGEIFADGVRNEVGIDFDSAGNLWGVEMGITGGISRPDLGTGDYTMYNPAEELNRFDISGGQTNFHGYPYCFSSYNLEDYPPGTQFAWHTFMNDGTHTDDWCRSLENVQTPNLAMPAHEAPIGITFYDGRGYNSLEGSFPCIMRGDAFVLFHGSTCCGPTPPVGYRVARLPFDKATLQPSGQILNVIFEADKESCVNEGRETCFRPVSVAFDHDGRMLVSVDSTGEIFKVFL